MYLSRLIRFVVLCSLISALSFFLSFLIRFELSALDTPDISWRSWFTRTVGLVVGLRLGGFLLFGLQRVTWRFAGTQDIMPLFMSIVLSTLAIVPAVMGYWQGKFPRSVLIMDPIICFVLLSWARFSYRLTEEYLAGLGSRSRTRVLVVGAGEAGDLTVRAMAIRGFVRFRPVAFLDDDPDKHGTTIQGLKVFGPVDRVCEVAARTRAEALVLALPTASTAEFYRVVRHCKQTGLPLKTIPDIAQILDRSQAITRVSDFRLEDLLDRRPIRTDVPEIKDFLAGRTVLVTGAAGSIGSELCRQIVGQGARHLVCLDRDESGLFRLEHLLVRAASETPVSFVLADVCNRGRIGRTLDRWRPDVVFHAAAYKHVPILQHHPTEAIINNVAGTRNLLDLATDRRLGQMVLISTDKAVNPTSVMGASKRIAEMMVRDREARGGPHSTIIRFGNVLGSNGSVVELFREQIRGGRPVTVTHPDIERFFMTIAEAVHLVLYAAAMSRGGETYILDMGSPVKIAELARQIIRLSGLTPEVDVPIQFTGLRPGEKLYEELWTEAEHPGPTPHPGILLAPATTDQPADLADQVDRLLAAARSEDLPSCWSSLLDLVPSFQGLKGVEAHLPPPSDGRPKEDRATG